jgi:hypothetical protein
MDLKTNRNQKESMMKTLRLMVMIFLVLISTPALAELLGTGFTYQGQLIQSGTEVTDQCDFNFGIWDTLTLGTEVTTSVDKLNVNINEGVFSVELDFGGGVFDGNARWLEIAVVCPSGGGALTTLVPRQELTATPYSHFTLGAPWSGLTGVPAGFGDAIDDVDDADADASNELQDLELSGNTLSLTGDVTTVDLSGYIDNTDDQTLAGVLGQGNDAGGMTITNLPAPAAASNAATMAYVDAHADGDSDNTNELQNLFATVNGDSGNTTADALTDTLSVVGAGTVSTAIAGDTLTITGSGISPVVRDPVLAGSLELGAFPASVYVSGRYAYVVDQGSDDLKVIDVSDPSAPSVVGSLSLGLAAPTSVYVSGRYAYVVDQNSDDLKVIDLSDPSAPSLAHSLAIGASPQSVYVSGRYAYVVDFGSQDLKVIDVSGVELPSLIAHSLEAGNLQVRNDMIAQGQLQVTGGLSVGSGGMFSDGNVGISGTIAIANDIAPTTSPANLVQLYAEDVAASSELKVRDEAGNISTLSPHNFSLIGTPSEPMAWSFYSENDHGKINVDMLRTVRLVEEMTGQKLVHIESNGPVGTDAGGHKSMGYQQQVALLIEAMNKLKGENDLLKANNLAMERRLEALERILN